MPTNLDPWLAGEAQTEGRYAFNQFECDGEHVNFGINFDGVAPGYLDRSHVMFYTTVDATGISTDPQVVPAAAWQSDTVIQLYQSGTTPYPAGVTLSIYRETPKNQPLVDFTDGSVVDEENLDTGFEQAVYGVAEMVDRFNVSNDNSSQAIAIANEANATANTALSTANTALGAATNAVSIANAATATANGAVSTANAATETANDAKETADGIAATAADALEQAGEAVTTANNASSTANGIAATANNALTTANAASSTANDAHDLAEQALQNVSNGQFNPSASVTAPTGSAATLGFFKDGVYTAAKRRWTLVEDNSTENTQNANDYSGSQFYLEARDNAGGNPVLALLFNRANKTLTLGSGWIIKGSGSPVDTGDLVNKSYADTKMPVAGGTFTGAVGVSSTLTVTGQATLGSVASGGQISGAQVSAHSTSALAPQGVYMQWNESSGGGEGAIINNKGSGAGGFHIRQVNSTNTVEDWRVTFGPAGDLTLPATLIVTDNITTSAGFIGTAMALSGDATVGGSLNTAGIACTSLDTSGGALSTGSATIGAGGATINGPVTGAGNWSTSGWIHATGASTLTVANFGYLNSTGAGSSSATQSLAVGIYTNQGMMCNQIWATSDKRIKRNIKRIGLEHAYDFMSRVNGYTFNKTTDKSGQLYHGFVAQEVAKAAGPDGKAMVNASPMPGLRKHVDKDGFVSPKGAVLSVDTDQIIAIHQTVLQDLISQIAELKAEVAALKGE